MTAFRGLLIAIVATAGVQSAALAPKSVAACPAPYAPSALWSRDTTPDGKLTLRVPPAFRRDGANSHWLTSTTVPDGGWFGLSSVGDHLEDVGQWVPAGDTTYKATDVEYVSQHTACREAIHGVAALVESGLLTGGIAGLRNQPAVRITWYDGDRPIAVMMGRAANERGQAALLVIARTVRFTR